MAIPGQDDGRGTAVRAPSVVTDGEVTVTTLTV